MVKASELRLGNYVWNETQQKAVQVDLKILSEQFYCTDPKKAWPPIKLTEEWLLKFGGEKGDNNIYNDHFFCFKFTNLAVFINPGNGRVCLAKAQYAPHDVPVHEPCLYVHSFQNLIYSLTSQELTVKNDKG